MWECIRPGTPFSLEDERRLMQGYLEHYNNVRLNGAMYLIERNFCLEEVKIHRQGNNQEFFGLGVLASCCWFLADLLSLDLTSRPNV